MEVGCKKILSTSGKVVSGKILLERKTLRGSKKDDERPKDCLNRLFEFLEAENLGTVETSEGRYKVSETCLFYISI